MEIDDLQVMKESRTRGDGASAPNKPKLVTRGSQTNLFVYELDDIEDGFLKPPKPPRRYKESPASSDSTKNKDSSLDFREIEKDCESNSSKSDIRFVPISVTQKHEATQPDPSALYAVVHKPPREPPRRHPEEQPRRHREELPRRHREELPRRHREELPRRHPEEPPSRYPEEPPRRYSEEPPRRHPEEPPRRYSEDPPPRYPEEPPPRYPGEPPRRNREEPPHRHPEEPPRKHPVGTNGAMKKSYNSVLEELKKDLRDARYGFDANHVYDEPWEHRPRRQLTPEFFEDYNRTWSTSARPVRRHSDDLLPVQMRSNSHPRTYSERRISNVVNFSDEMLPAMLDSCPSDTTQTNMISLQNTFLDDAVSAPWHVSPFIGCCNSRGVAVWEK